MKKSLTIFFCTQIERCRANSQLGTARNYQRTLDSFLNYYGGDISLTELDEGTVAGYDRWLASRGVMRNTSSFYMRNLRSVYNKAAKLGLVLPTNPFSNVYTGVDRTRKRAVDEEIIMRLLRLDLRRSYPLALSRDLFVFSYCTRGMSFIDVAFLRKSDISGGTITYIRRKTGQQMNVHIEPCAESIIKRYSSSSGPYVFPLITATDPETSHRQYRIALNYHNRKLKRISELLGEKLPMSTYTARHTWATTAHRRNVPVSVISAGMGHSSEKTTRIYLAGLENAVIDMANRGILEELNRIVSV